MSGALPWDVMPPIGRGDAVDPRVFESAPHLVRCEECGRFLSEHAYDTGGSCLVTGKAVGRVGVLCPGFSGM